LALADANSGCSAQCIHGEAFADKHQRGNGNIMNFSLPEEQEMVRETFARFLDENAGSLRVRAALPAEFDAEMWRGLAGGAGRCRSDVCRKN
jgi:hypothetical protein